MRFKKFAAIILMSTMIGTMSLSGCGGVNKDAVAITMTSDDKDAIEVTMGYANFAARIQQAGYDSVFASYYGDDYWTNDSYAKDGKNMQESIKDSVLESIETQYLLEKHMSDYGVEITEKTGNLVGVKAVNDDNEIMIINTEGIIIRMKVSDISILGRVTSGVKLINMENDVTVASITKVKEDETLEGEEAAEDAEETDAETATEAAADEQK